MITLHLTSNQAQLIGRLYMQYTAKKRGPITMEEHDLLFQILERLGDPVGTIQGESSEDSLAPYSDD